jgi:rubredoxin
MTSKWKCRECGSINVQISLPTWYRESQDGDLMLVDTDYEADPIYWYCEDCDTSDNGSPAFALR